MRLDRGHYFAHPLFTKTLKTMLKKTLMRTQFPTLLSLLLITGVGIGCGSGATDASDANAADAAAMSAGDEAAGGAAASGGHDHAGHGHAGGDGHDHGDAGDAGAMSTIDPWTRTYETAEAERAGTVENLHGLRATLVAELDAVRGRLKDGGRSADERKADTQRAAELAQGLEKLDRTIKQISEADNVTWADVRESNIQAAAEFRAWMAQYGLPS